MTFISKDGVRFYLQRKYIEANAGGFPPGEIETRGEVVQLEETAMTLELLFQFMYPQRHPNIFDLKIGTLAPLAEAAEKYEVFSAMDMCNLYMRYDAVSLNISRNNASKTEKQLLGTLPMF